ncbi:MAG TPA: molybdopterin cofactor-binding domain-containing protein [Anaerolineales bacterium]|nr:molybdopterin cofactor-binding domain-containing protein [Anaerolineales bacterium]
MRVWVNDVAYELEPRPGEMLSDLIRERLGLTGTKIGCDEAECGACTVLLDNRPVMSCAVPAAKADGRRIRTIEGVASQDRLHPIQEAFVALGAVQCGFCIPGQIMAALPLIETKPDATADEIRHALKDTLCRCAGYPTIVRAVQAAGEAMRTGAPIDPPELPQSETTEVVGRTRPRPDAVAKVTGAALYTDDFRYPGMLIGKTLRAGIPHATLRRLEVDAARRMPGVRAVLTAAEIPGEHNHGLVVKDWPVLVGVGEKVRTVGDAVAIVAADDEEAARRALRRIVAEYAPLPVVHDPVQSRQLGSPVLHESGNLLKHIKVRKGDVAAGLAEADLVLDETFHTAMTEHAYLEPECSIARPLPDGRIEVVVGSQIPYADREDVARCLGLRQDQVRVIGALIGGGFGGKEDIAGQIHAAMLAQATGRPVKILYDRHESLLVHPKRHATQVRVRIGAHRDGTLTACETELYGDTGAYASLGDKVMTRATTHSAGPYVVPHVKADCYAMYTNNPPAGAFRGFGVTQSAFAIESIMDELAGRLGLDPVEIRRRNALRVGSVTNTGQRLTESVGLVECIDRVEAEMRLRAGGDPFKPRLVAGRPNLRRVWGFAASYKNTGLGGGAPDRASAEVELYDDGSAEVRTSSAEIGQGLVAVLQMIAAEELRLPPDRIHVLLSDTDLTPDGGPTTASRQTYVTGNAVRYAAEGVRQAMSAALAERFDCPPDQVRFVEGLAQVDGQQLAYADVVRMMKSEGRQTRAAYEYWAPETQPLGTDGPIHFAFSFATQAAEIEVDTETGEVRVLTVIAANDVGRTINPLGLLGQVEGGVMMGLGNALTEEFIVEDGRVFTDRLARYRMPGIHHTPEIVSIVVEHPTTDGPHGAKGVGEIVSIPTTPAITNAIAFATGVRIRRLPVDQDWLALEIARRGDLPEADPC